MNTLGLVFGFDFMANVHGFIHLFIKNVFPDVVSRHRYGRFLKILTDDSAQDLNLLMKHLKVFLSTHRVKSSPPQLRILSVNCKPNRDLCLKVYFLYSNSCTLFQNSNAI